MIIFVYACCYLTFQNVSVPTEPARRPPTGRADLLGPARRSAERRAESGELATARSALDKGGQYYTTARGLRDP